MIVASACLVVIAGSMLLRLAGRNRPLEPREMNRLRRLSERLQREDSISFE